MEKDLKKALVLAGGGARGIAHVGALKALESIGFKPDIIVGCSMGAIIGGIYACGTPVHFMEDFLLNKFVLKKYTEKWTFQLAGGPIIKFIQVQEALNAMIHELGVDNGEKILALLKELTQDRCFDKTEIPFACNAVDILSGNEVMLNEGNLAEAIRASMSIPGVFTPVRMRGMLLVDGGVVNNEPLWIARKLGANRILTIQVSPFVEWKAEQVKNGLSVLLRAIDVTAKNLRRCRNDRGNLEVVAYDGTHTMDFDRKERLIRLGEEAVLNNRNAIEKAFLHGTGIKKIFFFKAHDSKD